MSIYCKLKITRRKKIDIAVTVISNFQNLERELKLIKDENDIIRCIGRLEFAPIPYEARAPILIYSEHPLAKLIVLDIHRRMKHITLKQTLTELRQKYWICRGRNFVRKILRECTICRKVDGKSYQYPPTPALTPLRLNDERAFATTGIDNFGPIFVRNVFIESDEKVMHKAWVTLYTCAASRAIILDLVPRMNADAFIRSFKRFVSRRGCPDYIITDNGSNFVAEQTQTFVSNLGVNWAVNLPLAPWYGGFFERLVRSVKNLLKKELKNYRLSYEEMGTVLCEIEQILNNRPLTYVYTNDLESCLTPNHLLFGRNLLLQSNNQ